MTTGTTQYQAKFFAHALTLEGGTGVERLTQSLLNSRVDLNPHQVEAALFALHSPLSKGVLLADEVGLGKTIEAGLVMCQYWAERKRKILVVCPAPLRRQWQCELEEKFNLPCEIVDAGAAKRLLKEGFPNPYEKTAVLISSYQFAARSEKLLKTIAWDLVVMDEAHKLRNSYRESNKVGQALKWALEDRRKLLLTATPLQNSLTELYGIATLLDDSYFGDLPSFRSRYANAGGDIEGLRERLCEFSWRTLRKEVSAFVKYTKRFPITESFACTDRENALYEDVSRYLQDETTYAFPASQRQLLTLVVRKVQASSSIALVGTLEKILERLRKLHAGLKSPEQQLIDQIFDDDPDLIDTLAEDLEEASDDLSDDSQESVLLPGEETNEYDAEKLNAEIALVEDFIRRARTIGIDKKTQHLALALQKGWVRLREIGAEEKAVIFTESRRTMTFLKDYLESNGYAGNVVTFSGGGKRDETSEAIFQAYKSAHPEDKSSRAVMMRHALVDAFKNNAKILIATEAGAEGINLQFCSMVVNYDLPWNPQRVEQRIGRCHRYGQKNDVIVVNFLNTRNAADVRVYELLEQKFRLFEGLFGASNDILGVVDTDGKSFERRINEILQSCRSPEEIKEAFDKLQSELQDVIAKQMEKTQRDVLENLDDDVRKRLKIDYGKASRYLSESEQRFMTLTRHVLGTRATFSEDNLTFTLTHSPSSEIAAGTYSLERNESSSDGMIPYRPGSVLGEWVLAHAKSLETPCVQLNFDISSYPGKISSLEALKGKSGWLYLEKLTIEALDKNAFLLFTWHIDGGKTILPEDAEKLFNLSQTVGAQCVPADSVSENLQTDATLLANATVQKDMEANNELFRNRLNQLDKWVSDQVAVAERDLVRVKEELRAARRAQDIASNQEELHAAAGKVAALEKEKRRARNRIDDAEDKAVAKREKILTAIKQKMGQSIRREEIFTVRWSVI